MENKFFRGNFVMGDRAQRLLDARTRLFGRDNEFLAQQERDRQLKVAREKLEADELARKMKEADDIRQAVHEAQVLKKRMDERSVREYNMAHLKKTQRSAFNLSDPEALKKEVPLRQKDDESLGVSSAQVFLGEKPNAKQEALKMREELLQGLQTQLNEKEQAKAREKALREREYQQVLVSDAARLEVELQQQQRKKELNAAIFRENDLIISSRSSKDKQSLEERQTRETIDLEHHRQLLKHKPTIVLSLEEKEEIIREQARQRQERQLQIEAQMRQRQFEAEIVRQQTEVQRTVAETEAARRRQMEISIFEENRALAEQIKRKSRAGSTKHPILEMDSGLLSGFGKNTR